MSPDVARTGPVGPVWRCPLTGVDRKWLAVGQTGAFDPYRTFDRDSKKAHCDARYLGRLEIIDLESGSAKCIAEHSWLPVAAQPWRRSRPRPAVRTCCLQEIGRHRRTRLSSGSQT